MGEAFIDAHPWRGWKWFREANQERLKFFQMSGIATGLHRPPEKSKPAIPDAQVETGV
jgi:hypothetical protein